MTSRAYLLKFSCQSKTFKLLCSQHYGNNKISYRPPEKRIRNSQRTTLLSLRSKRFQSSYCAKVRAEAKKTPPPRHSFFLLLSQLSKRTSRGNACYAGYTLLRATACCFHHILIIGAPVRNIVGVGVRDSSNRINSTRTIDVSERFEMFV